MINIYSVIEELSKYNWTLLADEYKNLKTPMLMKCPKGHKQEQSLEKWRRGQRCDACLKDSSYRIKKNKVPEKSITTFRTLALDAATNITGFSVYDNEKLVCYGTFKAKQTTDSTARINEIKNLLIAAIDEWKPDYIGIENIQLQTYGKNDLLRVETYRVLANLQGVLCDVCYEKGIEYKLIPSSTWRSYCGVSGYERADKKKEALSKVKMWYGVDCTDDEADAICIGKYCVRPTKPKENYSLWGEKI